MSNTEDKVVKGQELGNRSKKHGKKIHNTNQEGHMNHTSSHPLKRKKDQ